MADNSAELGSIRAGLLVLADRVGVVATAETPAPLPASAGLLFALDFGRPAPAVGEVFALDFGRTA